MKTATKPAQPDLLVSDTEVIPPKPKGKTAVAIHQNTKPMVLTPIELLSAAQVSGAPPELLEKYMALYERWEANEARKAFVEAFAAFKSEAVTIIRNKTVTDGPLKGKSYAELFSFVDAVTPALSKHGLSASWNITKDEKDWIEVTCTIEHVLGHARRVPMGGPPDAGGAKNAIQARASTVTYLERHTLKAACGIAERGDDKDGNGSGNNAGKKAKEIEGDVVMISKEQLATLAQAITFCEVGERKFCSHYEIEKVPDLPASKFDDAMAACKSFADNKKDAKAHG